MVEAVLALYVNSRTSVKAMAGISGEFNILVGVHQGSVLSQLRFVIVMRELTKENRKGVPWELTFADDLALTEEYEPEVMGDFVEWKAAMESNGLKVNMEETKLMVTDEESRRRVQSGRWPCGC